MALELEPSDTELNNKLVELWTDRSQSITPASFRPTLRGQYHAEG